MQKKSTGRISTITISCRIVPIILLTSFSVISKVNAQFDSLTGVIKDAHGASGSGVSVKVKFK